MWLYAFCVSFSFGVMGWSAVFDVILTDFLITVGAVWLRVYVAVERIHRLEAGMLIGLL